MLKFCSIYFVESQSFVRSLIYYYYDYYYYYYYYTTMIQWGTKSIWTKQNLDFSATRHITMIVTVLKVVLTPTKHDYATKKNISYG